MSSVLIKEPSDYGQMYDENWRKNIDNVAVPLTLAHVASSTDPEFIDAVARITKSLVIINQITVNPATSAKTLIEIAERQQEISLTIAHIAAHPNTPKEMIEGYLTAKAGRIRQSAAGNITLKEETLRKYLIKGDVFILLGIASNRNVGGKLLAEVFEFHKSLADTLQVEVAKALVQNPNLQAYQLRTLASTSKEPQVRAAVAQHPNSTTGILRILSKDKNMVVVSRAAIHEKAQLSDFGFIFKMLLNGEWVLGDKKFALEVFMNKSEKALLDAGYDKNTIDAMSLEMRVELF